METRFIPVGYEVPYWSGPVRRQAILDRDRRAVAQFGDQSMHRLVEILNDSPNEARQYHWQRLGAYGARIV